MKILSVRKQKDGSAKIILELDEKEQIALMIIGLNVKYEKKFRVLTLEEAKRLGIKLKGLKRYEMTDEEVRQCIEIAVNDILKQAIKRKWKLGK
jgi:hypothetical protein